MLKWAWFFKANTDEERHTVAVSDPTLLDAEAALLQLSGDPIAREYAYRRELELIHLQNELDHRHKQGLTQGRKEATVAAIATLCTTLDIELGDARQAQLAHLDFDALQGVHSRIAQSRTWPL